MAEIIECPSCGVEVEITEALTRKLHEKVKEDLSAEVREASQRLEERAKKLKERERAADASEESIAARVEDLAAKRIEAMGTKAKQEAEDAVSAEVALLKEQLSGASAKLREANEAELQLRKDKAALEADREAMDLEIARRLDEERDVIKSAATKAADDAHQLKLKGRDLEIDGMKKTIDELRRESQQLEEREKELKEREKAASANEESIAARVEELAAKRIEDLSTQAKQEAEQAVSADMEVLKDQLNSASDKLKKANTAELQLRKDKAALEAEREAMDLEIARRLDEERAEIKSAATKASDEAHQFQLKDRDQVIDGMKKTIAELQRKSEQGSQQVQGESLEVTLEDMLAREFPSDAIEPVPKGVSGADIVQRVRNPAGADCGVILWESKRTKNWSNTWLPKLRDDQRSMKAEFAALVSIALPADAKPVSQIDGVWVSDYSCAPGLARALRQGLLGVSSAKQALEGKQGKMDLLYAYLTGPQFRNRVDGLLDPFRTMMDDLQKERAAIQRLWSKREKQIERAAGSTSGLYGDLQGIVGGTIPEIDALALPALEQGEPEGEDPDPAQE